METLQSHLRVGGSPQLGSLFHSQLKRRQEGMMTQEKDQGVGRGQENEQMSLMPPSVPGTVPTTR